MSKNIKQHNTWHHWSRLGFYYMWLCFEYAFCWELNTNFSPPRNGAEVIILLITYMNKALITYTSKGIVLILINTIKTCSKLNANKILGEWRRAHTHTHECVCCALARGHSFWHGVRYVFFDSCFSQGKPNMLIGETEESTSLTILFLPAFAIKNEQTHYSCKTWQEGLGLGSQGSQWNGCAGVGFLSDVKMYYELCRKQLF